MFESVLTPEIQAIIDLISRWPPLPNFYLSGGTAAALQIGHRISNDLDFFCQDDFRHQDHTRSLRALGRFVVDYTDVNTLVGRLNEIKVGFFHYPYRLLKPPRRWRSLKIASLEDIACSKIDAISSRGKRRDFIDLYFIMKALRLGLDELFQAFEKKYSREQHNLVHIRKSLVFFIDAEEDPDPQLLVEYSWEQCKSFFIRHIRDLAV